MAAGATCKMRCYQNGDIKAERLKMLRAEYNKLNLDVGISVFEIQYQGAFSNGFTEISPPNAEFDGTSESIPLAVSSSDAKDTAAGAGVRKIKLICIDTNNKINIVEYTMNGTTAVKIDDYPKRIMHIFASAWGSEYDAAGNIILASRGYQQTTQTFTATTALSLTPGNYKINVNVNGGGATELTLAIGATDTFTELVSKLNTAFASATLGCTAYFVDSKLRIVSDAGAGTSTIAVTAGSSADLIAALNISLGGFSFASAVNGVSYLQITAGKNDSDGSAIYLPETHLAYIEDLDLVPTTRTNEARTLLVKTAWDGCDNNEDPDFDYEIWAASVVAPCAKRRIPIDHISHRSGKLTISESYVGGAETGWVSILVVVFDLTKEGRGIDIGGAW